MFKCTPHFQFLRLQKNSVYVLTDNLKQQQANKKMKYREFNSKFEHFSIHANYVNLLILVRQHARIEWTLNLIN